MPRMRGHDALQTKLNPRHRLHFMREEVLDRHSPMRHALVVGITAECFEGRPARLNSVGIGIGPQLA